jgi:hypothetical protein
MCNLCTYIDVKAHAGMRALLVVLRRPLLTPSAIAANRRALALLPRTRVCTCVRAAAAAAQWQEDLTKAQVELYTDIFLHLDLDGGNTVDENELLEASYEHVHRLM